jgi:hypothetical protein
MFHSAALILAVSVGQPPVDTEPWKFDELVLQSGAKFVGLVLDDTGNEVRFRIVSRRQGRPTVFLTTTFPKREVATTRKLEGPDRQRLTERLAEIAQDMDGRGEWGRMDALELETVEWNGKPRAGRRYDSDYFTLVTGAPDDVARRAAVRLEQLSAALRRFFPPRITAPKPTTVLLAPDLAQYHALVGRAVLNPALYDPVANRVVCGTDLSRLGTELTGTRLHHQQQLTEIDRYEADVRKLYKGQKGELDRYLDAVRTQRKKVLAADKANGEAFDKAVWDLFAVLFHEAFHAYVETFAYPPANRMTVTAGIATGELPRWLNEGLAQVFETAFLDAGELRVDRLDPNRLTKVKILFQPGGEDPVPLATLFRAGPETFLAVHASQKAAANRAYQTSWAVAVHLLLEKRIIGGDRFNTYLRTINSGGDPVKAFEDWVGTDIVKYEKELTEYILKFKANGP